MYTDVRAHKKQNNSLRKLNSISIIIPFVVILVLFIFCKVEYKYDDKENITEVSRLKELETKDIAVIDGKILAIKEEMRPRIDKEKPIDVKVAFANTIFMGDSISEGLSEYEILNPSSVMAIKGRNTISAKNDVESVVNLNPANIVMFYGMNDMLMFQNASEFVNSYEELINSLESKIPNTRIFINSVMPANEEATESEPSLNKYVEFNIALQEMCKKLKIQYVDTTYMLKDDSTFYEQDGIHMVYKFYPQWLEIIRQNIGV